jgi:hypothetical protein
MTNLAGATQVISKALVLELQGNGDTPPLWAKNASTSRHQAPYVLMRENELDAR